MALETYLEDLGFRNIDRILKISYGTGYQWVKLWETSVSLSEAEGSVKIVELDELRTYVRQKITARYGLLLIDLVKSSFRMCVFVGELFRLAFQLNIS